jgi:hypothetical protein
MNVFGAALLAAFLQVPEPPPVRNPWDGFAPGSSAVRTFLTNAGTLWMTTNEILESRTEDGLPLIRETTQWNKGTSTSGTTNGDAGTPKPFTDGLWEALRRKETITIKGRKLDCDVVAYTEAAGDPQGRKRLTVWHASELSLPPRRSWVFGGWSDIPATVIRIDSVLERNETRVTSTLEVLDLSSQQVVNGVPIDCVEEESRSFSAHPSRPGVVRGRHEWLSPQVPGTIIRSERECGTTEHTGHTTMLLVEFKALR